MADQRATITREKYEAGIKAAAPLVRPAATPTPLMRDAINAFLAAAGIEVERTAEERIAAFVSEVKAIQFLEKGCLACDLVRSHFPEVGR